MTENTTPTPTADNIQPGQVDSINAADIAIEKGRKRRKNNTSTEARNAYNNRAYDRIEIRVRKGDKDILQAAAADAGQSTAAFIVAAINAYTGKELLKPLATNPYI